MVSFRSVYFVDRSISIRTQVFEQGKNLRVFQLFDSFEVSCCTFSCHLSSFFSIPITTAWSNKNIQHRIYILSCQKQVAQRQKNCRPKFLFLREIFPFLRSDSCQNRAQRGFGSQDRRKGKISRRKRIGREFFYRRCNRFLAAKINFLC